MNERERLSQTGSAPALQALLESKGFDVEQARSVSDLAYLYRNTPAWLDDAIRPCESPIERRFLLACWFDTWLRVDAAAMREAYEHGLTAADTGIEFAFDPEECDYELPSGDVRLCIRPQASPFLLDDEYELTCDFSVQVRCGGRQHEVYIELDGHDWHERTKEQASSDRSRDRRISASGIMLFRFTGADVNADAMACEREVIRAACRWLTTEMDSESQAEWTDWHEPYGRVRRALQSAFRDGFTRGRSHQRWLKREATCR
jgi:hypothetical protein